MNDYQKRFHSTKGAKPGSSVVSDLSSLLVVTWVEILSHDSHVQATFAPPSRCRGEDHAQVSGFHEEFRLHRSSDCTDAVSLFSDRTHSIVRVSNSMCGFLTWRFRCRHSSASVSIRARPLNLQCKFPSIRWRENLRNGLEPKLLVTFLTCGREL